MSTENSKLSESSIERRLTDLGVHAVKLGKVMLFRAAIRLVSKAEKPQSATDVPAQRLDGSSKQEHALFGGIVSSCEAAFATALEAQLRASKDDFIRLVKHRGVPSEYIAIRGGVFLHRPTVDTEEQSPFPFWLVQETAGIDTATNLPTLYAREVMIDALGNMQSREDLYNGQQVLRQLNAHEVQPYVELLESSRLHRIVPHTKASS